MRQAVSKQEPLRERSAKSLPLGQRFVSHPNSLWVLTPAKLERLPTISLNTNAIDRRAVIPLAAQTFDAVAG